MENEYKISIEDVGEQLRAKISSKFQVSALLAGFGFTVLSMQVTLLQSDQVGSVPILNASILVMVASMVLYIFSLIRMDELTKPKKFWKVTPLANRTDNDNWGLTIENLDTLQKQMVYYWNRLTLVAIGLMSIALFIILLPFPVKQHGHPQMWYLPGLICTLLLSVLYAVLITKNVPDKHLLSRQTD